MHSASTVRTLVVKEIAALLEEGGRPVPPLNDHDVLMHEGLDSLSFAVLITRLEERLGYDPFTEMDMPVYPRTVHELTNIYARHQVADRA